jgi:ABC-type transport system substrate-binding protein
MNASYWNQALQKRLSRRRALAAAGGLAAGAAILSACGGGDEAGGGGGGKDAGVIYKPADTTKSAKRGGTIKAYATAYPGSFDLQAFPFGLSWNTIPIGSKLMKFKPAILADPELAVTGDLAESFEYSPDKLTLTIKLHPQAKWSPLSPSHHAGAPASIANRQVDADDVVFSWERWSTLGSATGRFEVAAKAGAGGPVESLTKVDNRTVQLKYLRPNAAVLHSFASWEAGRFWIYPKEGANNAIDFAKMLIGAGPFYIDKSEPSVGLLVKRNPNYELRDAFKRPFADAVDMPVLQDPAAFQGQLRAGNVWHQLPFQLRQEELFQLKKDLPDLLLTLSYASDPEVMRFGISKDSPFKDVRVRLAMSYAWDRDTFVSIVHDLKTLEANGIEPDVRWNAGFPCNETGAPNGMYKGTWLNPKSKDFGENAKYFTLGKTRADDVAEAKRLLAAAGFPNGVQFTDHLGRGFITTPYSMDVLHGIIADAGFKATRKQLNPAEAAEVLAVQPPGNFVGTIIGIDGGGSYHPGQYVQNHYGKGGAFWPGTNPKDDGPSADGDPWINDQAQKMLQEFDLQKVLQMGHEFQRYVAKFNYRPRYPGGAFTVQNNGQAGEFGIVWPVLQNHAVWNGNSVADYWVNLWIDESKPPVNKKA